MFSDKTYLMTQFDVIRVRGELYAGGGWGVGSDQPVVGETPRRGRLVERFFWCWDRYPTCASFVGLPRTSRGSAECSGRTRWMCDRAARPEPKHRCTSRVTGPNINVDGLGM